MVVEEERGKERERKDPVKGETERKSLQLFTSAREIFLAGYLHS